MRLCVACFCLHVSPLIFVVCGGGDKSGGNSEFAPVLAKAAVAVGADGVFIETHPDPTKAWSDGPNMIPLRNMGKVLSQLVKVHKAV